MVRFLLFYQDDGIIISGMMDSMSIRPLLFFAIALPLCVPGFVLAQELQDREEIVKARVTAILLEEVRELPGLSLSTTYQTLEAEVLSGSTKGNRVTVENDYLTLKEGDVFYAVYFASKSSGTEFYSVSEPYRLPMLAFFLALFLLVTIMFGGRQGVRGLIALALSFFFIGYILLPSILAGYSPTLVAIGVASLIIITGSYITHGINKTTSIAIAGMIITILISGALAYLALVWGQLTGFSSDESVYLNVATSGNIDFAGLLFGAIIIGLLGVLYDAAIGQAIAVEELARVGKNLSRRYIFDRALRIGREHIGALVNTLAIAYVGAALPLLLLFYALPLESIAATINRELFATEIIRILIGSTGVILSVPVTTALATLLLVKKGNSESVSDDGEDVPLPLRVHGHRHG